jgi:hypothetical protein
VPCATAGALLVAVAAIAAAGQPAGTRDIRISKAPTAAMPELPRNQTIENARQRFSSSHDRTVAEIAVEMNVN